MARIPTGNFGNQVAGSGGRPSIPAAAYDTGGRGLQQVGEAGMRLAAGLMDEERQQEAALTRARAANSVLDREMTVKTIAAEIEQDVGAGKIKYADAPLAYKQRLEELGPPDTAGLDPVTTENLMRGFKRADFQGETQIGKVVQTARIADFKTQTDTLMDKLGKGASLPGADVGKLNAQIDGLDEIGAQAYGKDWGKIKQSWRDKNWDNHVGQLVLSNANSMEGLNALEKRLTSGDLADKLDSDRRNVQAARIAGMKTVLINKAEAAANRAEREAERHLKRAEAEFNTFQGLVDKGTVMDPAYVDRVVQATAGTPYQRGIVALARQANETGGIASKPLAVQQAAIDAIDQQIATNGRTPELDKRREQLAKVYDASRRDLKENGLRAGLERGVLTNLAPIDVSTPEAFAASVGERLKQAETVGLWAGRAVSPLDSREADGMRSMLEALPPKQRSQAVATVAQAVGPRAAAAIAAQLDERDKPLALSFALAGSKTSSDRYTSELILKGAGAIKDGAVMKDDKKVTGWKATIAQQLDGVFPNEQLAQATKDAAYFIAAGIAQENGGTVSGADLERSVRLALGGSIIERNGKKLPLPAGLEEGDLEKRLRSVTGDEIARQAPGGKVRVGGVEMAAEEFARTIPGQELMYAGPGRFAVIVRGRPVVNAAGRPIIIGVQ